MPHKLPLLSNFLFRLTIITWVLNIIVKITETIKPIPNDHFDAVATEEQAVCIWKYNKKPYTGLCVEWAMGSLK